MILELSRVSSLRVSELEIICSKRFRELVLQSPGQDLSYLKVLEELCMFANTVEEVCLISATTGKFLLK